MAVVEEKLISIQQVLKEYIPISKPKLYQLINDGKLKAVKLDRRTFVKLSEIARYITSLEEIEAATSAA